MWEIAIKREEYVLWRPWRIFSEVKVQVKAYPDLLSDQWEQINMWSA